MIARLLEYFREKSKAQALELLFDWFGQRVYRAANFILNDHHLAEEVTQETFLAAYKHLDQLKDIHKAEAWLVRIAINEACDVLRERKKLVPCALIVTNPASQSGLLARQERLEIEEAILGLPPEHQAVIFLKYYGELTTKQIAQALDIPEGTVKTRLRKARDILANALAAEDVIAR
ncbi:MAG: sigma-70 family RNA polymerase sigma factor [Bacillota bacterium]